MAEEERAGSVKNMFNEGVDAAGGMLGKASAAMTSSAEGFVTSAAISDMYEIQAANVAIERSSSNEVQAVARQMIEDHSASTKRLKATLGAPDTPKPQALPTTLDARRRGMVDHLREAPDDKFDETYLSQQTAAHEEAATLMKSYSDKGDNEPLRIFATEVLPVIEGHLERMKALADAH